MSTQMKWEYKKKIIGKLFQMFGKLEEVDSVNKHGALLFLVELLKEGRKDP